MGRNALTEWTNEELAIIKRRETLSNGKVWPMSEWDYTEFEEFFQELKGLKHDDT